MESAIISLTALDQPLLLCRRGQGGQLVFTVVPTAAPRSSQANHKHLNMEEGGTRVDVLFPAAVLAFSPLTSIVTNGGESLSGLCLSNLSDSTRAGGAPLERRSSPWPRRQRCGGPAP